MNEIHRAQKYIVDKLTGAAQVTAAVGTRIFANQAPETTTFPYVLFNLLDALDTRGVCTRRLLARPLFGIKVISKGSPSSAVETAVDAIDELFQQAVNDVSEGFVFSSRREFPISYPQPKDDSSEFLIHYGGAYRLYIHPVAT